MVSGSVDFFPFGSCTPGIGGICVCALCRLKKVFVGPSSLVRCLSNALAFFISSVSLRISWS